jgi:tetratricopeptide (TPR) repeat protein
MVMLGRLAECRDLLLRHWPQVERLGDPALTGLYCFWLAHVLEHLGRGDEAAPWAERALTEAAHCGDTLTQGKAHYELSMNAFWKGRLLESVDHGQRAVALFRPTSDTFFLGHAAWFTGFGLIWLGQFADALGAAQETREIGDRTGDLRTRCYGDQLAGWARACLGDLERAGMLLKQAFDQAPDPLAALLVGGVLGFAQLEAGEAAAAIDSLEHSAAVSREMRIPYIEAWITAWLGEGHLAAGHPERARSLAEAALAQAREVGFPLAEGLAQRLRGRVAAAAGRLDEAADRLEDAMRLFAARGARYEVARTHLDLANVARAMGRIETGAHHLCEARVLFEALEVPRHGERAATLAREPAVR